MKYGSFYFALAVALMMVLLATAQSQKAGERKVAALPVVEGDPDETPKDRITGSHEKVMLRG
ncbi:MAG TPA: hypothetical protein VFD58_00635 [Blastocatellia bacterium]|nr:hypothetical protein [Blastocatellia bacterium]